MMDLTAVGAPWTVKVHNNTPLIRIMPPLSIQMGPAIIQSGNRGLKTDYREGQVAENE